MQVRLDVTKRSAAPVCPLYRQLIHQGIFTQAKIQAGVYGRLKAAGRVQFLALNTSASLYLTFAPMAKVLGCLPFSAMVI